MDREKIYKNAEEYGDLHTEDCCSNFPANNQGTMECCEHMQMIKSIIDETIEKTVEFLSHDMNFKDEKQRKESVKMYLKN